jgi:hypothetical protein
MKKKKKKEKKKEEEGPAGHIQRGYPPNTC